MTDSEVAHARGLFDDKRILPRHVNYMLAWLVTSDSYEMKERRLIARVYDYRLLLANQWNEP